MYGQKNILNIYKKDPATGDFKIASGMDDIIELDFHNPDIRKSHDRCHEVLDSECDIDGFRCDLASWVELEFWKEARTELDAIKPLFWLGEFDPIEHPEYMEQYLMQLYLDMDA